MVGRLALVILFAGAVAGTALAAGGDPRDPQKRHNAADQAWARAIRIQRSDLGAGDWRVEPHNGDDRGAPKDCRDPDLSDLVETGSAENPDWSRNGSFVGTGVGIFATAQQATTAWQRLARQQINRCLVTGLKQGLAGSGVRMTITSTNTPAHKLAPHFISGRLQITLSTPQSRVKGRFSYYLYARGRATVMLLVASFGRPLQPISESLEQRLATLVAQRLKR
jgi:hypothetical protein